MAGTRNAHRNATAKESHVKVVLGCCHLHLTTENVPVTCIGVWTCFPTSKGNWLHVKGQSHSVLWYSIIRLPEEARERNSS